MSIFVTVLHRFSVATLALLWVFFVWIIIKLFYTSILDFYLLWDVHKFLENAFYIFLFIEIIASIKIYFKNNYHFPLRFFLYMWITDLTRHLIVSTKDWNEIIYIWFWIILLALALAILEIKNYYIKNKLESAKDFEL